METFKTGKMTEKGQIVVPVDLRRKLELEEGDRLEFILDANGNVAVRPLKKHSVLDTYGVFKTNLPTPDLNLIRDQVRKDVISSDLVGKIQED